MILYVESGFVKNLGANGFFGMVIAKVYQSFSNVLFAGDDVLWNAMKVTGK